MAIKLPEAVADHVARCATNFLDGLDGERRRAAQAAFEPAVLHDWHYFPRRRPGLSLAAMTAPQRHRALAVLDSVLSQTGSWKAHRIMALEGELIRAKPQEARDQGYDPLAYDLVVFGRPGLPPWGWRFEGHHLSLTMTATPGADGGIAATFTPCFMGANPAVVHDGPEAGLAVLSVEQDLARDLVCGLDPQLRAEAVIAGTTMGDIVTGPGREDALKQPQGLALARLDDTRRNAAMSLVEHYVRRLRPEAAERHLHRIAAAGIERIHFAWAGAFEPGRPHYYRLHGPALLIEYDNSQDDANHIHTVWHEPGADFGGDVLARHYGRGHHAGDDG